MNAYESGDAVTPPTPLQRKWRVLCAELGREDGNARVIALGVLSGLISIAILLPFIMT